MHDPVMMDRGFLTDRETTRRSFYHAAWISISCIIAFGLLGIFAGANAMDGESMNAALTRLSGDTVMLLFSTTLVISAMSTLDSTLSSSAKLVVVDMKLINPSLFNGRIAMLIFMLLGLLLVFTGNKDLFSAVAVSGTASMYLAPVIFFSLWGGRKDIPVWSYVGSFLVAICGAVLYFLESSAHTALMGDMHKYTKLLWISISVLSSGCLLFWLGGKSSSEDDIKREQLKLANCDIVIGGHCGLPFGQTIDNQLWLNAGVIGLPGNDGTPDGWYLLIEPQQDGIHVSWHRLQYDHLHSYRSMKEAGLDGYADTIQIGLCQVWIFCRNLSAVPAVSLYNLKRSNTLL